MHLVPAGFPTYPNHYLKMSQHLHLCIQVAVPCHPNKCPSTWELCDTVTWEEIPSSAERLWTEWQNYHKTIFWCDGRGHVVVLRGHSLQTYPRAERAGLLQDKEWGVEGDASTSCVLPDAFNNVWAHGPSLVLVTGSIHRPVSCKWKNQVQSLVFKVRFITSAFPLKWCNLN